MGKRRRCSRESQSDSDYWSTDVAGKQAPGRAQDQHSGRTHSAPFCECRAQILCSSFLHTALDRVVFVLADPYIQGNAAFAFGRAHRSSSRLRLCRGGSLILPNCLSSGMGTDGAVAKILLFLQRQFANDKMVVTILAAYQLPQTVFADVFCQHVYLKWQIV